MVRDTRIKNHTFTAQTFSATSNLSPTYSEGLNGELLDIEWSFNRTGSVWIATSGAAEEVWRRNAPSGAGTQTARPVVYLTDNVGNQVSGTFVRPYVLQGPIYLAGSGFASGTQTLSVTVRYR